ncbi:MAG: nodulation protein NfeD [Actinomycetota bacterium]|nr:nodulation protein NfeD [Actinomycetota bacterium]
MRAVRLLTVAGFLAILAAPAAASNGDLIVGLTLDGVVDPFEASYITGQIDDAETAGASAVLITIDTPGGLDSSMRDIIQSILNSPVPVVCYVAPEGARAASAGAFILLSCDVAAMAPGTNVGAASPVGVSGVVERRKVLNDAAAYIRSLAERSDRNPDWAERAVRDAASASAEEALDLGVIDLIASSPEDLLDQVDGRTVEKDGESVVLETAGVAVETRGMGLTTSILHHLLTPNFAFLFFFLGLGLIVVEFLHPGISVAAILGILSLAVSFAALGMLPVQLIGVVLLVAAVGFFLVELHNPGISVAGVAGLIALVAGGSLLFDPSFPGVRVSPWMILPVAAAMALFFIFVVPAALRTRRLPVTTDTDRLIGVEGLTTSPLTPEGTAQIASELWSVESVSRPTEKGERVRVVAVDGLRLKVEPIGEAHDEERSLEHLGGGQ